MHNNIKNKIQVYATKQQKKLNENSVSKFCCCQSIIFRLYVLN